MRNLNFFTVATLILGTLKLLGYIDWAWWWVLAPAAVSIAVELVQAAFGLAVLLNADRDSRGW